MSLYRKNDFFQMKRFFEKIAFTEYRRNKIKPILIELDNKINNYKTIKSPEIKNIALINDLLICYILNKHKISLKCQRTFWHEFGHLYEAFSFEFELSLIVLIDKKENKHHLFFLKNNMIHYNYLSSEINNSNGVIWFHGNPQNYDVLRSIALGGFQQDFTGHEKNIFMLLISFGLNLLTLKSKENTDASFFLKTVNFKRTCLQLNEIHEFLYSELNNDLPDNGMALAFPLSQYKKIISNT